MQMKSLVDIVYVNVKAILSEVGVKKLYFIVFQTTDTKTDNFVIDLKTSQNAITLEVKLKIDK